MKLMYLLVMLCIVIQSIAVPVYRGQDGQVGGVTKKPEIGGHTFSYMSDIADMKMIRRPRAGKVVHFLEQEETSISPITPSSVVS